MIKKFICGLIAVGSFGFSLLAAEDAFVGTWKLNVARSKFAKGREAKDFTVVIATEGDTVTVTVNGTLSTGQTISQKFTEPTTGGPLNFTEGAPPAGFIEVSTRVDDRTVDTMGTMNGKQILMQHAVVSADHKTVIIKESGMDEKGQACKEVTTYDRQ